MQGPRIFFRTVLVFFCVLAMAGNAVAQTSDYPNKPIKIVVGYAPGGGTDVTTRIISQKLSERIGQPVIVENRPGADAIIGTEVVAKAAPDGYTLLAGASGQMVYNPGLYRRLSYNTLNDFIPITLFNKDPMVIAVNASVPANSLKELIALAKAKPGKLFYSSAASAFHVATELLKRQAGVDIVYVPYKGAAPAVQAVVAGEVSVIVMSIPPILSQLRAGKLRALAITGAKRSPYMPEIPLVSESGIDFDGDTWAGLFAPAGTPKAVIDKLYSNLSVVLKDESIKKLFAGMAQDTEGMGMPPAQFDTFVRTELADWTKVINELNIHSD